MTAKMTPHSVRLAPTAKASIQKSGHRRVRRRVVVARPRTWASETATLRSGVIRLKIALRFFPGNDSEQLLQHWHCSTKPLINRVNQPEPVKFQTRTPLVNNSFTVRFPAETNLGRRGTNGSMLGKCEHAHCIVTEMQQSAPVRRYETC